MTRTRTLAIPLVAAAGLLVSAASPAPAPAGTYTVRSCSNQVTSPPSALKGVDNAWAQATNDPTHLEFAPRACPPFAADPLGGLLLRDRFRSDEAPVGAFAEYRFDAPEGTTLTSLRLWRQIGKRSSAWELYTRANDTKLPDSDCELPPGVPACPIGAPNQASAVWTGLNATSFAIGIRCTNTTSTCPTGETLPQAWTAIYGSEVTVDDPTPPTVAAESVGGALVTDQYVSGSAPATISSATDGSGIQRLELREGTTPLGQRLRPCDFTRRSPCTNITTAESVNIDTTTLADGDHAVELRVIDAGGNGTTATSRTVTVDNTAPLAPTPASPTAITVNAPTAGIAWTDPDAQLAPIAAAHLTVCGPIRCERTSQAPSGTATVGLTQGHGGYVVSVSLEDAAGNHDPANRATWTVDFPAPPAAAAAVAPAPRQQVLGGANRAPRPLLGPKLVLARPVVGRDRRTITVRGTVAPGVTGTVTVTASARIRGRTRTVTRRTAISRRRYAVRLRLPSRRWRAATVTVRYPGSATRAVAQATRTVRQRAR